MLVFDIILSPSAAVNGAAQAQRPLAGIRMLEMGQLVAGPFAGCMLAYFRAEVVKVEPPGAGDPLRNWRVLRDGTSLWWRAMGRNKKCITLNLREPRGRVLARALALRSDVLIENFRPGTMERWGLDPDELRGETPELVYTRVSGYGQTGPVPGPFLHGDPWRRDQPGAGTAGARS